MLERTHSNEQNTGCVKESAQPNIYITMMSSLLGPIVRKLEALEGHYIEGRTNNIETYNIKVNTLVAKSVIGRRVNPFKNRRIPVHRR